MGVSSKLNIRNYINLFGYIRVSVRTRVVLQKLINYDPKKDKPIYAQHHTSQIVHKDDENIDENDLIQRQKLLAKEPEIPEMYVEEFQIKILVLLF